MNDCLDRPLNIGDYALMYSEYESRQIVVRILKHNEDTHKITLERHAHPRYGWQKKTFVTNYWPGKFYKLESGYYLGDGELA